jgi:hypothetical protein
MNEEAWKDVVGYEGLYGVSNTGKLRGLYDVWRKSDLMGLSKDTHGYYYQGLHKDGKNSNHRIHRLVAIAFIPNPENKPQVNHINGVKTDNRVENLEWVTSKENHIHAVKMGLRTFGCITGENSTSSKLKDKDILDIRAEYSKNPCVATKRTISAQYNVTIQCIHYIVNRISWKHI